MSRTLDAIETNDTFQIWLERTNDIVDVITNYALTASVGGDTTTGNATLVGSFTANTVIATENVSTNTLQARTGTTITVPNILSIQSTTQTDVLRLSNTTSGSRATFTGIGSTVWKIGNDPISPTSFSVYIEGGADYDFGSNGTLTLENISATGTIAAIAFIGDGSQIDDISASNIVGTLSATNIPNIDASKVTTGTFNSADRIPNLPASKITSGTFPAGRVDDIAHGNRGGGNLHANATTSTAGFMSSQDKVAIGGVVPVGGIIMWSGSIGTIPANWALCNGSNGTPDLRDRFIVGAGSSYAVGATGGANSVTLNTTQIPAHRHTFSGTTDVQGYHAHPYRDRYYAESFGGPFTEPLNGHNGNFGSRASDSDNNLFLYIDSVTTATGEHAHNFSGTTSNTGNNQPHENRPPYYALAYIMRIQ